MGPFSQVPGLAGYQQQVALNDQSGMQNLGTIAQLMNMQKMQREMQYEPEDRAMKVQMQKAQMGNYEAEAADRNSKAQKMNELFNLSKQISGMPQDHPERQNLVQRYKMLASPEKAFDDGAMNNPLGKLFKMKSALPPGDPRHAIVDNAIRKESETAKQISPTVINNPAPTVTEVMQGGKLVKIDARTGRVIGDAPTTGRGKGMSATAQKELIETEEQVQGGQAAIELLKQAKAINNQAMGFSGAGAVASAGSLLPEMIRPESIDATQNLDNILQSSALPQLKAIFGGMPTEGERKILLDVQGSSSKPPKVRAEIFKRAEAAINNRLQFSQDKAKSLRDGSYFSEGGATPQAANGGKPSGGPKQITNDAEYNALPVGALYITPSGETRTKVKR